MAGFLLVVRSGLRHDELYEKGLLEGLDRIIEARDSLIFYDRAKLGG